jgi:peptide/nickel transport system substrate-binding protein
MMPKKAMLVIPILLLLVAAISCASSATTSVPATTPAQTAAATTTPAKATTTSAQVTTTPAKATTTTPTAITPTPVYGGILKIACNSSARNLGLPGDVSSPDDYWLARPAVETLVGYDEEGKGTVVPRLATAWQYSSDYKSLTFTLRKGVKFHDGTDFNAEAAKTCLDLIIQGKTATVASVSSVDVIDDYTIRLNLSYYDAALLNAMCDVTTIMVSPTAIKTMGKDLYTHPVGTGPYKFVSYQLDVALKYERFDGYWGGKPYLDGLEFTFIKDAVTQLLSYEKGEVQAVRNIAPKDALDLKEKGNTINYSPSGVIGLASDSAHSDTPFSNLKVRQAFSYAIDTNAIAKAVGHGFFTECNQAFGPSSYAYNPNIVGYPYNPDKAKALLAEAGYASGLKTTIIFSSSAIYQEVFTAAQGYLKQVGIDAQIDATEKARFTQIREGGWNNSWVFFGPPGSVGYDPGAALSVYLSSKATRYDPKSIYIPADYDAKLSEALVETNTEKRKLEFQELSKMIIDQYCLYTPFYLANMCLVSSPKVHGFDLLTYSGHDWRPERAWLSN